MSEVGIKIFVSYRRADTRGYAGWLSYCLEERYGRDSVFRDVDSLEPGVPFMEAIEKWIKRSDVVLCLIGDKWSTITDSDGARRLDDLNDPVRAEVATALKRKGGRTIPVLIEGSRMPIATDLPEDIRGLTNLNGHVLSDAHWRADVEKLDAFLQRLVREKAKKGRRSKLSGADIVLRFDSGTNVPTCVGVAGGLAGKRLTSHISGGTWEDERYEVLFDDICPEHTNWSSVDAFVERIRSG
jgi:hypothetical protein